MVQIKQSETKPRPKVLRRVKAGLQQTVREYAETSTTHGISYVFEDDQPMFERILWLIITAVCVTIAITLSILAYLDWQDNPVVTFVSTTALPIENITFPAVTICGQGLIQEVVSAAIMKKFGYFVDSKGKSLSDMTSAEKSNLYEMYLEEKFNGLDPKDIIFSMALPDPDAAAATAVLSAQVHDPVAGQMGYCFQIQATNPEPSKKCSIGPQEKLPDPANLFTAKEVENFGSDTSKGTFYSDSTINEALSIHGFFTISANAQTSTNPLIEVTTSSNISDLMKNLPCQDAEKGSLICVVDDDVVAQSKTPSKPMPKLEKVPPIVDKFLDPIKRESLLQDIAAKRNLSLSNFKNLNLTATYRDLFEILWYSQLPCFDVQGTTSRVKDEKSMVKRCFWKGFLINCALIFNTFPTDHGMCCTFNMKKAEEMFQSNRYSRMVTRMQENDFIASFGNPNLPAWYKDQNEPNSKAGKYKGLTLILDAHTDIVSPGTVSADFQGFYALVEENSQFPLVKERSFLIQPGHTTNVALSATGIVASSGIKNVSPLKRNCYFPDEYDLLVHRNYSRANCLLECFMDYAHEQMSDKCTPWYFPTTDDKARPCDPWLTKEFLRHMEQIPDSTCSYCLPDCEGTVYETSVTCAPFRRCDVKNLGTSPLCSLDTAMITNPPIWSKEVNRDYQASLGLQPSYVTNGIDSNERRYVSRSAVFQEQQKIDPVYNAYEKDIAVAHFYFNTPTVFQFSREARMSTLDYVSQIGGLLGLFIGFSVISGAEIVYWLTFRLARNQKRHLKTRPTSDDEDIPDEASYYPFESPVKPMDID